MNFTTNNPCINCEHFKRVSNYEWGVGFCSYNGICINGSQKTVIDTTLNYLTNNKN